MQVPGKRVYMSSLFGRAIGSIASLCASGLHWRGLGRVDVSAGTLSRDATQGVAVLDLAMLVVLGVAFAAAAAYVRGCDALIRTSPQTPEKSQ